MDYDQQGNVLDGLSGEGDPTIGTSAAEIFGSFPSFYNWDAVAWNNPLGVKDGVMVQEAQTLSPYIVDRGPQNQPHVSVFDVFNTGVNDLTTATRNAVDAAAAAAENLGVGATNLLKWGIVALIAVAVLETNKTVRMVSPARSKRNAKRRRK